jgi:hypothetical protein
MDLCVFYIILNFFKIQMDQEAMSITVMILSNIIIIIIIIIIKFIKFYYFYRHANFCFCTLYFQYPSTFGNFLYHASQLKEVFNLV